MSGGGVSVNRDSLVQRLQTLNITQQSIEGTAKWCLFYIKDAKTVVNIWLEEFGRVTTERRIAFLYLANHILQEGRKKGREFADEFFRVLPKACAGAARSSDAKLRSSARRLVDIWDERKVFGSAQVKVLKQHLDTAASAAAGGTPGKTGAGAAAAAAAGGTGGGAAGGGGAAADGGAGPGTPGGAGVERRKLAAVGSLADVLFEVANAAARSSELQTKCLQAKGSASSPDAGLPELSAARGTLAAALDALRLEGERRKKAVTYIRMHLSQQEDSLKRNEEAAAALAAQKAELDARHAALEAQEREQREQQEREEAMRQQMQQQQQQQAEQQQQVQQHMQQQHQQQQAVAAAMGMGPDGFMGIPGMVFPPFPLPGMPGGLDPAAFNLPGMPPFPAGLLGPPPNLAAMLGGMPGFPMGAMGGGGGGGGGVMQGMGGPMGGGGGGVGGDGGGGGGMPDLAGALSSLAAAGFGGGGGGHDMMGGGGMSNGAGGLQQQPSGQMGGGGAGPGPGSAGQAHGHGHGQGQQQAPGGAPPQGEDGGQQQHPHLHHQNQHPQHPQHPQHQQQHQQGQPPPQGQGQGQQQGQQQDQGPGGGGGGGLSGGMEQLAAALASNSDLVANVLSSMSQEERARLGSDVFGQQQQQQQHGSGPHTH